MEDSPTDDAADGHAGGDALSPPANDWLLLCVFLMMTHSSLFVVVSLYLYDSYFALPNYFSAIF